jgi:hypothetical protein
MMQSIQKKRAGKALDNLGNVKALDDYRHRV